MNSQLEQVLQFDDIKTSELLKEILGNLPAGNISLGSLIEFFDQRSFGSIFLLLAMLCLLPGVSIFAGFIMLFPAAQMALGFSTPTFPKFIREHQVAVSSLQKWGLRTVPSVSKLEQFIKPRYMLLTHNVSLRLLGLFIVLLALVVTIPFPLSNYLPAIAVMFLSLGLLQNDGLMIVVGIMIGVLATVFGVSVFYLLFDWLFAS